MEDLKDERNGKEEKVGKLLQKIYDMLMLWRTASEKRFGDVERQALRGVSGIHNH